MTNHPNIEELRKQKFLLSEFKSNNRLWDSAFENPDFIKKLGTEITEVIKKTDLTYTEAYASLQYAYDLLQFESNYVQVPKEKLVQYDPNSDKS